MPIGPKRLTVWVCLGRSAKIETSDFRKHQAVNLQTWGQTSESFAFKLWEGLRFETAFDDERQDLAVVRAEIIRIVLKITASLMVVIAQSTDFVAEEFDVEQIFHV
jgi:hypothetical protein